MTVPADIVEVYLLETGRTILQGRNQALTEFCLGILPCVLWVDPGRQLNPTHLFAYLLLACWERELEG